MIPEDLGRRRPLILRDHECRPSLCMITEIKNASMKIVDDPQS